MEENKPVIVDTNILLSSLLMRKSPWKKAYELCKDIDETDTPYVALTMELDGLLFTGDQRLKKGLKTKGFDSFFEYSKKRRKRGKYN